MFDDQNNSQGQPPANLPTEPVDMFAGVEKSSNEAPPEVPNALEAGMLKKKEGHTPLVGSSSIPTMSNNASSSSAASPNVMPQMEGNPMYAVKEPILGKVIMALLLAVILGGLGYGGWWVYANYMNPKEAQPVNNIIVNNIPEAIPEANNIIVLPTSSENTSTVNNSEAAIKMNNDKILFGEPIDSDKDGLDDVRENEIGTDPNNPDTDGDILLDGEEVIIFKTNPLNSDTDSDSYKDGEEVKNGYNPLGPGRLFNPNTTSTVNNAGTTTSTATSTVVATTTKSTTKTTATKK